MQHVCNWNSLPIYATRLHLAERPENAERMQYRKTNAWGSGNEPDQDQDQEGQEIIRHRRRRDQYWMAVGTMAAYATFGSDAVFKVYAQQDRLARASTPWPDPRLDRAPLRHSARNPGLVLACFRKDGAIQRNRAPELDARYLVSGRGRSLHARKERCKSCLPAPASAITLTGPDKVMLEIQGMATTVDVTDTGVEVSLPKYSQAMVDTPQSIDIVPQHILEDQGATTLRDTLRNVAGISIAAGEGGAQGDNLTVRGFTARNDIFLDGMRDFGSYYRDPFDMQEVAVLQGPSSVTFGRGSTGGIVNQETKVPQTAALFAGTVDLGTDQTKRITADLDRPLPSLGNGTAFRLNLMGHDSKVRGKRHCREPSLRGRSVIGLRTGFAHPAHAELPARRRG